jgi:Xaa-Pro dipeptidase
VFYVLSMHVMHALFSAHFEETLLATRKLMANHQVSCLVLRSGDPKRKSRFDDQWFPLRVTPHFQRFVPGLNEPAAALVIRQSGVPELYWPKQSSFWEGIPSAPTDLWGDSMRIKREPYPEATSSVGLCVTIGEQVDERPLGKNELIFLEDFDVSRRRKTLFEIACMREATRIASLGHEAARKRFASSPASELQLHLAYLDATSQDDSETPYKCIVAQNRNAGILHHILYERAEVSGPKSFLLDAGATCLGYQSDITRTWVATRQANPAATRFADLCERVDAVQMALAAKVTANRPYESIHEEALFLLGQTLLDVGLTRGASAEALVASKVVSAFFPHGIGHSIGLQTHDVGCKQTPPRAAHPFLRHTGVLEAGQVVTIEPGLYFIPLLLEPLRAHTDGKFVDFAAVAELSPFGGIRIEDNVLCTDGAPENLTRLHLPRGGGFVE